MQYDISICIPANREEFLKNTVEDILAHKEAKTEIIVGLDGAWANPGLLQHPDVNVIYVPQTIGQRKITDTCVQLSKAKYIIKCDGHCSFDQGFDRKMLESFKETGDNVVMVPVMRNLHAFSFKCHSCGFKKYQGPTITHCEKCGSTKVKRKMVWKPRKGTFSTSYAFDSSPHFAYFQEYKQRPEYIEGKKNGLTETMNLQGSFFMTTRQKYIELGLGGDFGSWGNQAIQVACSFWLSGGRVLVNHKTWYSHLFRTQGGDFSFPYDQPGNAVDTTKKKVWDFILQGKIPGQIHPPSWLVSKFWPIPPGKPDDKRNNLGWTQQALDALKEKEKGV